MTGKSSEKLLFLGLKFDLKRLPLELKSPPLKKFEGGPSDVKTAPATPTMQGAAP